MLTAMIVRITVAMNAFRMLNKPWPASMTPHQYVRMSASPLTTAAQLVARVTHSIQPTSKLGNRPNAARVYRNAPPVPSKRLPASAKFRAMSIASRATRPTAIQLHPATWAASEAGSRNTPLPITWFTPTPVRSQRPSARRRAGWPSGAVAVMSCVKQVVS
jgi:hypothetical protein